MLKREDAENQLVYYQVRQFPHGKYGPTIILIFLKLNLQAGIGTYTIPELVKPWMSNISKTLDMMLGSHLDAHIMGKPTQIKLCEPDPNPDPRA